MTSDMYIINGSKFAKSYLFTQSGSAVNLSGWTANLRFLDDRSNNVGDFIKQSDATVSGVVLTAGGLCTVNLLAAATTALIANGVYAGTFQLKLTDIGSLPKINLDGSWIVEVKDMP